MNGRVFKKMIFRPALFTLIVVAFVLTGITKADESARAEGVRLLEDAIKNAAVHSYAVFGHFPESLDYISHKYGIYIDETRFIVHYEVAAINIMPDIRVFEA